MIVLTLFIAGCADDERVTQDLKVAFFGDQGLSPRSKAVLRMVKAEGAHMVLHLGDFDYADDAEAFEDQINRVLGEDFPYFAVIGNHDVKAWPAYQRKLRARLRRISGVKCEGDVGYKAACTYKGLFFTLSAVGIWPEGGGPADADARRQDHATFIRNVMVRSDARWKVCAWHKNQHAMQVGKKKDETGWEVYEACREAGAIIATGHDHSYSRTHLISAFRDRPAVASTSDTLRLEKGRTFGFVSGLGGKSARGLYLRPGQEGPDPWWAATYTRDDLATAGALFCTFNPGRHKGTAKCYFKAVEGDIVDRFTVLAPPEDRSQ
ncbi:MAG: metallophosphoesterase [Rhodospirillales bacterium]|nr:metallophosphoesterase [Rhodospirillales bacterium]